MTNAKHHHLSWHLSCIILLFHFISVAGAEYKFRCLNVDNGLADSHINRIFKSKDGYLWFGTDAGLCRYDGFRFKNFYCSRLDDTSINSSQIFDIQEDRNGMLWIQTNEGCCIYDPQTEAFNRDTRSWMRQHGMNGTPDKIFIDKQKNFWLAVVDLGCYFYDTSTGKHTLFRFGNSSNNIPYGNISDFSEHGKSLVVTLDNGTLVCLDATQNKRLWINRNIPRTSQRKQYYHTFIDHKDNYWVNAVNKTYVYSSREKKWYSSVSKFLKDNALSTNTKDFIAHDIKEYSDKRLWIATEHNGLYIIDYKKKITEHINYDSHNPHSLPDNTLESIFIEQNGAVWIGTYKNGVAYYSPKLSIYATIPLGDVCTMIQNNDGTYWCGTNESGIVRFNPKTKKKELLRSDNTKLGSDVIVSSLRASDGSLWFGAYNGGLTHYYNGTFTSFRAHTSGLAEDCVWALAENRNGHIVIGTLGGGLQIFNPKKKTFKTYTTTNTKLTSNYISSVVCGRNGDIIIGHSRGLSIFDARTEKIRNITRTKNNEKFSGFAVNQVFEDSRGLIWNINMCGIDVYDSAQDKIYHINTTPTMAYAVTEDNNRNIWVTLNHNIIRITVRKQASDWKFFTNNYEELDGLQRHRYNYRSIMVDNMGNVIVGGQDGINVLPAGHDPLKPQNVKVIFSGVVLFDHPLNVGENYNGHTVLGSSLNTSKSLHLKHSENTFSILLASDQIGIPQKTRFLYRMKGMGDDKWLMTIEEQPNISYTNLNPGTYVLQVRTLNSDGSVSRNISELTIHIDPPIWMSTWAFIIYAIALGGILWLVWYITIQRKMEKMRLTFLTDISHELRTPLTLVIAPIKALLKEEGDPHKQSRLQLILRNANRLLSLVNETLDLRKIDSHMSKLNYTTTDIVAFIQTTCKSFEECSERNATLTFSSSMPSLTMPFDKDKMEKIIYNLLSNAYKFTPDNGRINVLMNVQENDNMLTIDVADTGCGISDEEKQHIFDRFYQAHDSGTHEHAGSGIGLCLVKEFIHMHGGKVYVHDNPDGGSIFTISLPLTTNEYETKEEQNNSNITEKHKQLQTDTNVFNTKEYEILIVDDSEDFLSFMSETMSTTYKVRTAINGKDALKKISEHKPDIILSDVMMPVMDGNKLCQAIRSNPQTERIPFIMLTARLAIDNKIEGMTIGADDYITKPFNFDLLNLRILNLIKWRNATPIGKKIEPKIKHIEITSADEKLVKDATTFVENNITNPELTVEMMSDYLNMSRVNLYKKLLSITGNTPKEFIRTIRLKHAEQMLREGQLNVSEVAYNVGFNNPKYFSKYFIEMFGTTPSQYKRQCPKRHTETEKSI